MRPAQRILFFKKQAKPCSYSNHTSRFSIIFFSINYRASSEDSSPEKVPTMNNKTGGWEVSANHITTILLIDTTVQIIHMQGTSTIML